MKCERQIRRKLTTEPQCVKIPMGKDAVGVPRLQMRYKRDEPHV